MSAVVAQRRPFTSEPSMRSARERTEQRAASAAALIEAWFDKGDRRLLERAREALEQALAG